MNVSSFKSSLIYSIITLVFFLCLWFWNYYSFLTEYFAPLFSPDSFDYFIASYYLSTDKAELIKELPIDLPMGFPYLLKIVWEFGGGVYETVLVQSVLLYISFFYLQNILLKFYKNWSFISLVLLSVFLTDSLFMKFSVSLLPEVLFTSSIAFLLAELIKYFNGKNNYILLGIGVGLPLFFRSNGIVFLFIPIFLLFFDFVNKEKRFRAVIYSWVGFTLFMLVFSFFQVGYLNYGNFKRVSYSVKKIFKVKKKSAEIDSAKDYSEISNLCNLIIPLNAPNKPFFNLCIQSNLHVDYISRKVEKWELCFDGDLKIPTHIKTEFLRGFRLYKDQDYLRKYDELNIGQNNDFLSLLHLKLYKIIQIGRRNYLFYTLSICAFITLSFLILLNLLKRKEINDSILLLFLVFCLHYINLILVSVEHPNLIYRYTLLTEIALIPGLVCSCKYVKRLTSPCFKKIKLNTKN